MKFIVLWPVLALWCCLRRSNAPAKLIKEFRKDHDKPVLKAAFVEDVPMWVKTNWTLWLASNRRRLLGGYRTLICCNHRCRSLSLPWNQGRILSAECLKLLKIEHKYYYYFWIKIIFILYLQILSTHKMIFFLIPGQVLSAIGNCRPLIFPATLLSICRSVGFHPHRHILPAATFNTGLSWFLRTLWFRRKLPVSDNITTLEAKTVQATPGK